MILGGGRAYIMRRNKRGGAHSSTRSADKREYPRGTTHGVNWHSVIFRKISREMAVAELRDKKERWCGNAPEVAYKNGHNEAVFTKTWHFGNLDIGIRFDTSRQLTLLSLYIPLFLFSHLSFLYILVKS
jgi:hypothetical protein